jgi:hypothetical protein
VQRSWHAGELERIIDYLRAGRDFADICDWACKGWSTCRFRGCREGEKNGSANFTDGEWYWPEGLAHYIQRHSVILPEQLIEKMCTNNWQVPAVGGDASLACRTVDYSFWIAWGREQQLRRWYSFWRLAFYPPGV